MLIIKTRIALSPIHGLGLFAEELIKTNTLIWEYTPGLDLHLEYDFVRSLPRHKRIELINYAGISKSHRYLILCGDNARFINHSLAANTCFTNYRSRAIRDIQPGEEITEDYREYGRKRK